MKAPPIKLLTVRLLPRIKYVRNQNNVGMTIFFNRFFRKESVDCLTGNTKAPDMARNKPIHGISIYVSKEINFGDTSETSPKQ